MRWFVIRSSRSASAQVPAQLDQERFKAGDCVKIVFRPEDVSLSKTDFVKPGHHRISTGLIEEVSFVGAYGTSALNWKRGGAEDCPMDDSSFYLTTQTPETQSAKSIIATRPKSEAAATRLRIGERVVVSITSFTVLPLSQNRQH